MSRDCLKISAAGNAYAQSLIVGKEGAARMGWRFTTLDGLRHTFAPLNEVRVKDYVLQPVLGGVVIFVDPESFEKGFGIDIDWDGEVWTYTQTKRQMPKIAPKSQEQLDEEKARRKKARLVRAAKAPPKMPALQEYELVYSGKAKKPMKDIRAIEAIEHVCILENGLGTSMRIQAPRGIHKIVSVMPNWSIKKTPKNTGQALGDQQALSEV